MSTSRAAPTATGLALTWLRLLLIAGLAAVAAPSMVMAQPTPKPLASPKAPLAGSCGPVNGLSFVCGLNDPEDMALVPGTRWLVTSGVDVGGGLHLVDTTAKTQELLYSGGAAQSRQDLVTYPHCSGGPDPARFIAHGIALRPRAELGVYRLYVVSHGDLEGVQIFSLDGRGPKPQVAWTGCVALPDGMKGNAVTALSDGTILVTATGGVGRTWPKPTAGGISWGAVFGWKPGDAAFHEVQGTEMSGPNGIEASLDEKEIYVVSSGAQTVSVFPRDGSSQPLRQSRAPLTSLDNLRWTAGHLIAAGMMADEPACGGTRQQVVERGGDPHACIRGYAALELNPATMEWRVVAYGEPNPVFGGVATAVPVGKTLWLSSFTNDRVAYRPLPGSQ